VRKTGRVWVWFSKRVVHIVKMNITFVQIVDIRVSGRHLETRWAPRAVNRKRAVVWMREGVDFRR
jgi:hypothetical protein